MDQYPSSQAMHIDYSVMAGQKTRSAVLTTQKPAIHVLLHEIPGSRDARPGIVE
jgi:hypothetical protein